ncbi:glycosyltransferase family 4 protein [uncultured Desulfuromonas sp.]|uniref:glycosyltransferase family 4 protein n=1 Tax=uncultured Desulfuromonas sp. TaxID=181013 RepID=UPI002AAC2BEB|nr:glycosyltransferase family 4 protein [uncultured Desulfuromonas sp.]
MRLAFVLFKYFPYGGLQRDCMKIAVECRERGHAISLYCLEWSGSKPEGMDVHVVPVRSWRNYHRYDQFVSRVHQAVQQQGYDGVIGFNRMPGLDVYFGADPCFAVKCQQRSSWYRFLPRSRSFLKAEQAVYGKESSTHILLLSDLEIDAIQHLYGTPDARFHLLPPGVARDRLASADYQQRRQEFRQQLGLKDGEKLLLMVGSGFRVKGADRALEALKQLPDALRNKTQLMILGRDNQAPFERMARQLGLEDRVHFMGGRDDAPSFLFAADLLIHPAYRESAGMVLLEAVAARLPVLVTDTCGYSFHIQRSGAGIVHESPFDLQRFTRELVQMLSGDPRPWQQAAEKYVAQTDIFGLAETAADVIEEVVA